MSKKPTGWKKRSEETTEKHIKWLQERTDPIENILVSTSMFERFEYMPEAVSCWTSNNLDKLNIFNCSVGGDKIENIVYRLQTLKVFSYVQNPETVKKIVILAGANDVERGNPEMMIEGFKKIYNCCHEVFPQAEVHVIATYPRKSDKIKEEKIYANVTKYNEILKKTCEQLGISFHDYGRDVLNHNNMTKTRFFVDNVHFSQLGYQMLAKHLSEILEN